MVSISQILGDFNGKLYPQMVILMGNYIITLTLPKKKDMFMINIIINIYAPHFLQKMNKHRKQTFCLGIPAKQKNLEAQVWHCLPWSRPRITVVSTSRDFKVTTHLDTSSQQRCFASRHSKG